MPRSCASRREAADWFDVSPSSAIKWVQRRQATGSIAPKPSGGRISPLEAHAAFLFALIANSSRSLRSSAQRILACRPGMSIAIVLLLKTYRDTAISFNEQCAICLRD